MATRTSSDLSRVTVVTPTRWADVALPADIPLVDVLPALVEHVGDDDLVDRPVVVQRLGGPPLDEESSAAALGIVDGETLYLRPVENQLPPIEFDDLVDGVAVGIREQPNRWTSQLTKAQFLGVAAAAVGTAVVVLSLPGPSVPRTSAAILLTFVLILLAAHRARGGDTAAATVIACAAQPVAALSGLIVAATAGDDRLGGLSIAPGNLLMAAVMVFLTALLSWCLIGKVGPVFAGTMVVATLAGWGALMVLVTTWSVGQVAAIVLAIALLLGQFLPKIAYPLAGLRVPSLPAGPADLTSDIDPLPGEPLLNRVAVADRYLTTLTCATSAVAAVAAALTAGLPDWSGAALIALCGTALTLRARLLTGRGQRIATTAAGLSCFQILIIDTAVAADQGTRLLLLCGLAALILLALVGSQLLPKRRLSPQFSWAADVLETLTAVSILPILFQVFGLYSFVRTLVG